ncbi:alkanesulfonate monooxygenase SsuD/methylene tetrahydromethanopterin reductase-like flavin-dependent oxidoreductase (luciferase family) [Virgibacillus halotolerans]|uniref:LLM class flavin-dependent oxidoreductase n=1 Tax=Virgibacillus halotolerans TaxID=1071053 RepID=UPI00195FB658|nr:LLM class flavin-dependent oxidoreductase [Virgibacillus halotolerans]MBM7599218.1 alkanesulfonate monooxygenase SsuD/methylene tetrahydromethanopterin reductase-like flavin-dependent oxidoreductase (luciferase family) [Virgibacillus halotolerans]
MRFGIYVEFQNPEQNKKSHEQVYREILEQIEHADKRGFTTFNTLEHHWFEEFSISANPMAFFAAAAQRTKNIRFRTCSHVLPLHNPMVFAGQVGATDILTGGRFEFAVGRGHAWVFPKASIPLEESRGRFTESLEILEKAFSEDTFSYHGKYYDVENVKVVPRPTKKPRILTGGASNHNYELAGKKGWGVLITPMLPLEKVLPQLDIYRESCEKNGNTPDIVFVQALYLDENGDKARKEAEPYIRQFLKGNVAPTKELPPKEVLLEKDFGFYASGALEATAEIPYQKLLDDDYVWVGSPEEIKERVAKVIEACPDISEISMLCTYAGMEHWKTIRTQDLFSQQIMPHFQKENKVKATTV